MDDRRKIWLAAGVGFLAAAVIGLAVALVVVAGNDEPTVTTTVSTGEPTATVPTVTTAVTTDTTRTATTQPGGGGKTSIKPIPSSFPSPRAAARNYARKRLGDPGSGAATVTVSSQDDSYALVTWFVGEKLPVAVWVRRQGAGGQGWVGLAGTTELSPAPGGLGIPADLRFPFSD